ncbi:HAD family hydrolase [uncultured Algibacter sp.]|uniref:HAD family hydrolase n=1 Tax=uncultured Algibacter sp. TaxID=298659 RepID=UPI002635771A|nr:HAD family hydrolase [uncultured Algibacter sp.]
MSLMNKKVVVFDLDDTLYNEISYLKSAFHEIALIVSDKLGFEKATIFKQMMNSYYSKENVFENLIRTFNLNYDKQFFIEIYRTHKPKLEIAPDRINLIKYLKKQNIPMCILTDGRSIQQRNKLEALGIMQYLSEIIISEEIGSEKPHKKNYKYFEKVLGKAQFFYIGDNPKKDFITPNKMGWITICIKDIGFNIHSQNVLLENAWYYPKYSASNFTEIGDIIKSI